MAKFRFEIQDLIKVTENGKNKDVARAKVISKLSIGHYEFNEDGSAVVSDGEEI